VAQSATSRAIACAADPWIARVLEIVAKAGQLDSATARQRSRRNFAVLGLLHTGASSLLPSSITLAANRQAITLRHYPMRDQQASDLAPSRYVGDGG
jgi:hypothetical protein